MNYTLNPLFIPWLKIYGASTLHFLFVQSVEQQCTRVKANLKSEPLMWLNCDHCTVNHNISVFNLSFQTLFPPTCSNAIQTSTIQLQQDHSRLTLKKPIYSVILMGVCIYFITDNNCNTMTDSDHIAGLLPDQYVHRYYSIVMWKWLLRREWNGHAETLVTETLVSITSNNWNEIPLHMHAYVLCVCVCVCICIHVCMCKRMHMYACAIV